MRKDARGWKQETGEIHSRFQLLVFRFPKLLYVLHNTVERIPTTPLFDEVSIFVDVYHRVLVCDTVFYFKLFFGIVIRSEDE